MARTEIPNALAMRELKYGAGSDADKERVATSLRALGRRSEALMLFEGRPTHPFVQEELAWARKEGAAFHLFAVRRLGAQITAEDVRACGEAAERAGRWMEARQCWVDLEDRAALERVLPNLPPSLAAAHQREFDEADAEESPS